MPYYEKLINDYNVGLEASKELYEYYHHIGDREAAYQYLKLHSEKQDFQTKVEAERDIYVNDKFTSHNLDQNYLDKITKAIKSCAKISKAYLVQKVLTRQSTRPYLCFAC